MLKLTITNKAPKYLLGKSCAWCSACDSNKGCIFEADDAYGNPTANCPSSGEFTLVPVVQLGNIKILTQSIQKVLPDTKQCSDYPGYEGITPCGRCPRCQLLFALHDVLEAMKE